MWPASARLRLASGEWCARVTMCSEAPWRQHRRHRLRPVSEVVTLREPRANRHPIDLITDLTELEVLRSAHAAARARLDRAGGGGDVHDGWTATITTQRAHEAP